MPRKRVSRVNEQFPERSVIEGNTASFRQRFSRDRFSPLWPVIHRTHRFVLFINRVQGWREFSERNPWKISFPVSSRTYIRKTRLNKQSRFGGRTNSFFLEVDANVCSDTSRCIGKLHLSSRTKRSNKRFAIFYFLIFSTWTFPRIYARGIPIMNVALFPGRSGCNLLLRIF